MISPPLRKRLDEMVFVRRILWLAMIAAVVIYGAVLYAITRSASPSEPSPMRPVVAALALASTIGAFFYKRAALSETALRAVAMKPVELEAIAGDPRSGLVDPAELGRLSLAEQRLLAVARSTFTPTILTLALYESIALFGLVLGFVEQRFEIYLPFAAVALALDLTAFPRANPFPDEAERLVSMLP